MAGWLGIKVCGRLCTINNYAQKIQNFKLYNFEVSEQSLSLQFNENHRSKTSQIRINVEIICFQVDSIFLPKITSLFKSKLK